MNILRAAIYNQINLHTVSGSNENLETYSDLNSNSAISQGFLAEYKNRGRDWPPVLLDLNILPQLEVETDSSIISSFAILETLLLYSTTIVL